MLSLLRRWLCHSPSPERQPASALVPQALAGGKDAVLDTATGVLSPVRANRAYNGPAERYLHGKYRTGPLGVTISRLAMGPATAADVRDALKLHRHNPIDAGRLIRSARAALRRSGITLRSAWVTKPGYRIKSYWLTSSDTAKLRELERGAR